MINAQTTHFIYDGAKLIGEYNSDGSVKNEYIYLNGTPLAVTNATQTFFIHTDHLGTPRRLADENANIVWSWESEPFGESKAVGSVKFDLRFAGQYFDNETKTHYNINRDYNPQTGRYLQSDPIGFDGGVNSYGYVAGNPLVRVDPCGKFVMFLPLIIEAGSVVLSFTARQMVTYAIKQGVSSVVAGASIYKYYKYYKKYKVSYEFDPTAGTKVKHPQTGEAGWLQNDGSIWVKDRAGGNSHGGSAWKRWNNKRDWEKGKKREGTYDEDGKRLRD